MKVWTFIFRGGAPFRLKFTDKIGPLLDHDGRFTVWKMVGTAKEAASVEMMFSGTLIGARVEHHTEEEDEEMVVPDHQGES